MTVDAHVGVGGCSIQHLLQALQAMRQVSAGNKDIVCSGPTVSCSMLPGHEVGGRQVQAHVPEAAVVGMLQLCYRTTLIQHCCSDSVAQLIVVIL